VSVIPKSINLTLSLRYDLNQFNVEMCYPYASSLVRIMEFTRSKTLDRSNINVPTSWLLSMDVIQSSVIRIYFLENQIV